jgi:hypothetical protein
LTKRLELAAVAVESVPAQPALDALKNSAPSGATQRQLLELRDFAAPPRRRLKT